MHQVAAGAPVTVRVYTSCPRELDIKKQVNKHHDRARERKSLHFSSFNGTSFLRGRLLVGTGVGGCAYWGGSQIPSLP